LPSIDATPENLRIDKKIGEDAKKNHAVKEITQPAMSKTLEGLPEIKNSTKRRAPRSALR